MQGVWPTRQEAESANLDQTRSELHGEKSTKQRSGQTI